jgi:hypothetical protein
MWGEIVALGLLSVAGAPRVGAAQPAAASARVTQTHVLTGSVGAALATSAVRVQLDGGEDGRVWLVESEARTNTVAQPVLLASAVRGAWFWQHADGTWQRWDGREIPVGATLMPGVHTVRVRLRGPAEAAPPALAVRLVPVSASARLDAVEPTRASGTPRR